MVASPDNGFVAKPAKQAEGVSAKPAAQDEPSVEQKLQDYKQLQERFLRTTNALGSAAHDLKTPLAIMNGYVELLQSEKLGHLNEKQREILRDMRSNGSRLQQFIQDFLTFSVLETGEVKMRFEKGDMNACLSEVCRLWSHSFSEKGLALYFLGNDKLPDFPFDSAKVQRVVSNLLENASKYTPSGGTIWLHAEPYMWERRSVHKPRGNDERRQRSALAHNAIKVSVSDTGPGIPAEYHIEVFDDFFRLPETEGKSEGMGLGLGIARRLINGMGGKIWLESESGSGCKFSFILPMKPPTTAWSKGQNR
ncbi:MAG TPA: HAMP domain-containing sensor histidine kinase [Terriglobales bacterium]|jgi:signal transduction histidine kinase